jgi:hypothetical protein
MEGMRIGQFNMSTILSGDGKGFVPDFAKILSPTEIDQINEIANQNKIDKDGKTLNEDF